MLVAWDTLEYRPTATRRSSRTSGAASSTRSCRAAALLPGARRLVRLRRRQGRRVRGGRLPRPRRQTPRRSVAGRRWSRPPTGTHSSSPPPSDHPPADARRERDRPYRPGGGAGALRRRTGAGPGLHRPPRRPLRQAAGRPGRRPGRRRRSWPSTTRSRTRSRRDGFRPRQSALRLYRQIARLDHSAPLPPLDDTDPDWAAAATFAGKLGLGALAGRLEERDAASKS